MHEILSALAFGLVLVSIGQEFDGSDSGARPDEALSWGKIKVGSSLQWQMTSILIGLGLLDLTPWDVLVAAILFTIKLEASPVKVYGDASLLFPLLVSQTFAAKTNEAERRARK